MMDILRTILGCVPLALLLYAAYRFLRFVKRSGDYWAQRDWEDYQRRVKYEESMIEIAEEIKRKGSL